MTGISLAFQLACLTKTVPRFFTSERMAKVESLILTLDDIWYLYTSNNKPPYSDTAIGFLQSIVSFETLILAILLVKESNTTAWRYSVLWQTTNVVLADLTKNMDIDEELIELLTKQCCLLSATLH